MTLSALFGYSLLISAPLSLLWVVLRGMFPRKVDHDAHEMIPPGWEKRS